MASPEPVTAAEPKVGLWHAIRDVGIVLANKDQFYQLAIMLTILGLFWMLPPEIRGQLVLQLLGSFKDGSIIGWVLGLSGFSGWAWHVRIVRRKHQMEIKRIAEERNLLQRGGLNDLFRSSNDDPPPSA